MKRSLIAILILTTGTSVFCSLHSATRKSRRDAADQREVWMNETQFMAQAQFEVRTLTEHVRELKQTLSTLPPVAAESDLEKAIAPKAGSTLSPELREKLLAELGFQWDSSGEFLVVSKETLRNVRLEALTGGKLTEVAVGVLALTDAERAAVESAAQRATDERRRWLFEHVQRIAPEGEVVAKYVIPADENFSQTQSNDFFSSVNAALDPERTALLRDYAYGWMNSVGFQASRSTELTLRREGAGSDAVYRWELHNGDGTASAQGLTPHDFPKAFRALFPNEWLDVAAREGFELPKEFKTKPLQP